MSADLQQKAHDHLWMHFTRQSTMDRNGVPIIVRGEGHHIWDDTGKKYIDGLAGLFVVNAGHGRKRLGAAVAPKEIGFLASLPRTRSGKIMRRLLKARELGLPEGDLSTLESDAR